MESDYDYFIRRANEERHAAMRAGHLGARDAHLQMAERYAELAHGIEMNQARLGLGSRTEVVS